MGFAYADSSCIIAVLKILIFGLGKKDTLTLDLVFAGCIVIQAMSLTQAYKAKY
jgi:hypothetical protein